MSNIPLYISVRGRLSTRVKAKRKVYLPSSSPSSNVASVVSNFASELSAVIVSSLLVPGEEEAGVGCAGRRRSGLGRDSVALLWFTLTPFQGRIGVQVIFLRLQLVLSTCSVKQSRKLCHESIER